MRLVRITTLFLLALGALAPAAHAFLDFVGTAGTSPTYRSFSVAASRDGRNVYSTGYIGNGVFTFSRDPASGELVLLDAIYDGTPPGLDGLDGAVGVAVSNDGRNVYVAALNDDSVAAFSRDPATGLLTWIGVWKDGVGGADGLDGARAVYVNPDGTQVYVAAENESAVAVFARDSVTGLLTPGQVLRNGPFNSDYNQASSVTSTPNGAFVYVAAAGVIALQRDFGTGNLVAIDIETMAGGVGLNSQAVAMSPDARHLYVTDFYADRTVCFAIDAATGALTYANEVAGGAAPGDPAHSYELAVSPDGGRVYVTRLAEAELVVYRRDPASGALTFEEVRKNGSDGVTGLSAPTAVAVPLDGRHVYAANYDDATVHAFATPDLVSQRERQHNGSGGVIGLDGADAIVVSPDGDHVYAASAQGAVASFDRNSAGGTLTFLGAEGGPGLEGAAGIAITPDGGQLLVAARGDDSLSLYQRNPASGALSLDDQLIDGGFVDGLAGASAVAVSPDGLYAYVASPGDRAVAAIEIAGSNLGLVEAEPVPGGGREASPNGVEVSPDGAHVYAVTQGGTVAIFSRAPDGSLDSVDTFAGPAMNEALAILVSPDGANVYVAGETDDAIVALERDPSTGLLSFLEAERGGVSGYQPLGLGGAVALAFSPDGAQLYAADRDNGAVVRFAREPGGALTFVELDRELLIDLGLGGASALAASADGRNLYVAAATDDSVVTFSTVPEPYGALASLFGVAALLFLRRGISRC